MDAGIGTEELWSRTVKTLRAFLGEGSISMFLALSVLVLLGQLPPFALLLAAPPALAWLIWPALEKNLRPKRVLEPDRLERGYRRIGSILRVMHVFLAAEAIALLIVVALLISGNLPVA
jgi:hypothetical protein